ncbi:MAG TPA: carboxypeptidase-like regulatory domain-containing protein, partial [Planctomycetota bacterium]|nr:carboxypeptidase-like regulatory domain-containing protein [Planctomycetota bacterium]
LAALLPFAGPRFPVGAAGAATLTLLMHTKLVVAAAAAVLLFALLPWALSGPTGASTAPTTASTTTPATANAPAANPSALADRREVAAAPAPAPAAVPERREFLGFVRDLDGRSIQGIAVHFEHDAANVTATTAADGGFRMAVPAQSGCLDVQSETWAAVRRGWLPAQLPAEPPVIVVAPARSYAGTVVDPAGAPVAGAVVAVVVAEHLVLTRAVANESVALPSDLKNATTDAQGHFAMPHVAWVPGSQLAADLAPYKTATLPLPEAASSDLLLRLGASAGDEHYVYGIAVDARSQPVADAVVAAGGAAVHSRADGRFTAPWSGGDGRGRTTTAPHWLRGVRTGLGAAAVRLQPGSDQPGWREDRPITLQFGANLQLRGRVVDADGKPVAGARVLTPDLTYLGIVTFEDSGHQISGECAVEGLAPGQDRLGVGTDSDADGRFTLAGLLPRSYGLFAIDPHTLAHTEPLQATPGDDVLLQLPRVPARAIAGRVVARDGTPLAAVRIAPGCGLPWTPPERADDPWAGAPIQRMGAGHIADVAAVITDADGRFAFSALTIDHAFLSLGGEAVFPSAPFALAADQDLAHLEVKVDARSTFRLHLQQPGEADAFSLVGADGAFVPLYVRIEGMVMSIGKLQFAAGIAPEAHTRAGEPIVVLWRGAQEVRRAPLRLPPGGVHDLQF